MGNGHSPFGPSSLERRALCPGSYWLEKDAPESTSVDADRGTDLHEVAAKILLRPWRETKSPEIDAPEFDALDGYDQNALIFCKRTFDLARGEWASPSVEFEQSVELAFIAPEIGWGTVDCLVYVPFQAGHLIDFKFGKLQVPAAGENIQLMAYALGVMRKYELDECTVTVCQPATRHISHRTYKSTDESLNAFMLKRLVTDSLKPNAQRIPGPSQCRYCKGIGQCPEAGGLATTAPTVDALALTPAQIAEWLDKGAIVAAFMGQLKARAHAMLEAGGEIPGYRLADGKNYRSWSDETNAETLAAACYTLKGEAVEVVSLELKSPAEIEKLIGKSKAAKAALEPLITTKQGAKSLQKVE